MDKSINATMAGLRNSIKGSLGWSSKYNWLAIVGVVWVGYGGCGGFFFCFVHYAHAVLRAMTTKCTHSLIFSPLFAKWWIYMCILMCSSVVVYCTGYSRLEY